MNKKENYEEARIVLVSFEADDVITTSTVMGDDGDYDKDGWA